MKWVAVALLVVAVLGAGIYVVLDRPTAIDWYEVVNDHTLIVTTGSGWLDRTRVTSVEESPTSVIVNMNSFRLPLPGTGGDPTGFTITLEDPLADREVIDGSTGQPIWRRPDSN